MTALFTNDNAAAWQKLADDCSAQRPSVGKHVLVTEGKYKGQMGIVTWHGLDKFASIQYKTDAQLTLQDMVGRRGWRVRISTDDGGAFFVSAEKVQVLEKG